MNEGKRIFIAEPCLDGNEKKYVNDCLDTNWISSVGKYVSAFEERFAEYCGTKYALTCANGTVSLQLAMLALGIKAGDEVIVPTFTYIASANTVRYCGATPIFVDSDYGSWNIDVTKIEEKITPRTKAIMPVHLYGLVCDMDPIIALAEKYGLHVIEDAAEAHGATYKGKRAGSFGIINSFSFFGNKIITTGEGGMVTTNDEALYNRMKLLRGQGMDPTRRYWFTDIGYNFRMTNLQAAVGLGQLENIERHINKRAEIAALYKWYLSEYSNLFHPQSFSNDYGHVYWMYSVLLSKDVKITRDELMVKMNDDNIETRPLFYPLHIMPPYKSDDVFTVAEDISARGLNLPTHSGMNETDVKRVADSLIRWSSCK